jgi:hypothetical protein
LITKYLLVHSFYLEVFQIKCVSLQTEDEDFGDFEAPQVELPTVEAPKAVLLPGMDMASALAR